MQISGGISISGGMSVSPQPAVPDAPVLGTVTTTATTATIPFTAPFDGFRAITSYTAISSPEGITVTINQAGSGTISVPGLTYGQAYTFTVTATNSVGTSTGTVSNSVTPIPNAKLYTWGYNYWGTLGLGDKTARSSPVQVGSDTNWGQIYSGVSTITARKLDGTLWNWGTANGGEMAGLSNHSSPVQIGSDTNWKLLSGARYSFFATKTDNTRYSWGYNRYCDLGSISGYSNTPTTDPTQYDTQSWKTLAGAGDAGFGIKTNGTLWTWGRGLLTGPSYGRSSPCQVGSNSTWTSVSVSNVHVVAVRTRG